MNTNRLGNIRDNMRRAAVRLGLLALCAAICGQTAPGAKINQPGDSHYTLELEPFARHTGENAIDLTHPVDGSGRVFVSTQSGQVFGYGPDGNARGVFLDLSKAEVGFNYDSNLRVPFKGLMYIAFHPDYTRQSAPGFGLFYTGHQIAVSKDRPDFHSKDFGSLGDSDVRFVVAEWRVDPNNPDRIDPGSYRQVMLLHFHTYGQMPHALGEIAFNPYAEPGDADYGKLYLAVGDAHNGDYNKPHNLARAQQTDNPFAKILRIDPLKTGDKPYTAPEDNPFGNETHAIGLRDAQWFSFAKDLNGETVIIACDIGALAAEEINVIRPGANYGWPRFEGTLDFDEKAAMNSDARPPVVQYGRVFAKRVGDEPTGGGMVAIMGGLVVSDPDDPAFQGQILFGDLPNGTLMHANYHHALAVEKKGGQSKPYILNVKLGDKTGNFADVIDSRPDSNRGDARFGVDEAGSVFIVSKQTGTIFKTRLIHTGLPIEAKPRLDSRSATTNWALIAIVGVTLFLGFELLLVWRRAKRDRAAQHES